MTAPTWMHQPTEAERLDASLYRMSRFCLYAGVSAVIGIALYGIYEHTHPLPTWVDVVRECEAETNGVAHVDRDAQGEVIGVRCDHPAMWRL